jgi:alpha-L-rhamnosidase
MLCFVGGCADLSLSPSYLRCDYRVEPLGTDSPQPQLSWVTKSEKRAWKQTAYQILVADSKELLNKDTGNLWDSGKVTSGQSSHVVYQGKPLQSRMSCWWKLRTWDGDGKPSCWSEISFWTMGLLNQGDWQGQWIGYDEKTPAAPEVPAASTVAKDEKPKLILPPASYLRKEFTTEKTVELAVVYVSAMGLYQLHINGQIVGKDYFTPGWTDYNKRLYYQTYDVTDMLRKGPNAIGAILADGWYSGCVGFGHKRFYYGNYPRLLGQLELRYSDGTTEIICTDSSWKAGYGPILEADFLMGETYDARLEIPGWDKPGFDDSIWQSVAVTEKTDTMLQGYPGVTVQQMKELKPIALAEPKPGVYVFDLGQNFAGVARLKVKGAAGDKVVLRFAEMVMPDGMIYTENLRTARCVDTYILKGTAQQEVYQPYFTYHGFRYVELTGCASVPKPDDITGIVLHSNTPPTGSFACSNEMVNKLYSNIVWSQRSNFLEVPTDCPQRDERLGWTGDAQIFIRTATYNMDVAAFFNKWLIDLEDNQKANGAFTDIAPNLIIEPFLPASKNASPAWGDAGIICPWTIYQVYGDTHIIQKHYKAMQRWIEYLRKNSSNFLRPDEGYGDWVSINADTPKDVVSTAYFAYSARLLSKMALAIGKTADAQEYENLFQRIKIAFDNAYVSNDAQVKGNTQTSYVLALYFDLLPDHKKARAAEHLVNSLKEKNYHLSTGFLGLSYLMPTLTEIGRNDLAYRLLTNDTFPSWGYSIKNGATTIWERWNGWTEENGFYEPGMNSFNHYSFGAVGQWLFSVVAGIDTEEPGFKKIIIKPQPGADITWAKGDYNSINGPISSHWQIKDDTFALDVTIPANTTAKVYIPAGSVEEVTESGKTIDKAQGVKFIKTEGDLVVLAIDSGSYHFVAKQK